MFEVMILAVFLLVVGGLFYMQYRALKKKKRRQDYIRDGGLL